MAKIKIVNADSKTYSSQADIIFTDPPYDMSGQELSLILGNYNFDHLLLIVTMSQLLSFSKTTNMDFCFDFVLDAVVPKKSLSIKQPNYTHQTGAYFCKNGTESAFNRKLRQRSDTFDNNGYWPTILRSPRKNMQQHGKAKNLNIITDILGSFDVKSVIDPFAGTGTTALAAHELGIDCTIIEIDKSLCEQAAKKLKFLGAHVEMIQQ